MLIETSRQTSLPHEVCLFGGGTGLPKAIRGTIGRGARITAGVTTSDSGGDAVFFSDRDRSPSFADFPRALAPLSPRESVTRRFEKVIRYQDANHKVRNILSSRIYHECERNFEHAIAHYHQWLRVDGGEIFPNTFERTILCARLENGQVVRGETNIDIPQKNGHDGTLRIVDLWIESADNPDKEVTPNPGLIAAIERSKLLILSAGDTFTSVLASFRLPQIIEAIRRSDVPIVFMLNLMTKYGETYGFRLSDFMEVLEQYLGRETIERVTILANSTIPSAFAQGRYREEHAQWVWVDDDMHGSYAKQIVLKPLLADGVVARHDPFLIGKALTEMFPTLFSSQNSNVPEQKYA